MRGQCQTSARPGEMTWGHSIARMVKAAHARSHLERLRDGCLVCGCGSSVFEIIHE